MDELDNPIDSCSVCWSGIDLVRCTLAMQLIMSVVHMVGLSIRVNTMQVPDIERNYINSMGTFGIHAASSLMYSTFVVSKMCRPRNNHEESNVNNTTLQEVLFSIMSLITSTVLSLALYESNYYQSIYSGFTPTEHVATSESIFNAAAAVMALYSFHLPYMCLKNKQFYSQQTMPALSYCVTSLGVLISSVYYNSNHLFANIDDAFFHSVSIGVLHVVAGLLYGVGDKMLGRCLLPANSELQSL